MKRISLSDRFFNKPAGLVYDLGEVEEYIKLVFRHNYPRLYKVPKDKQLDAILESPEYNEVAFGFLHYYAQLMSDALAECGSRWMATMVRSGGAGVMTSQGIEADEDSVSEALDRLGICFGDRMNNQRVDPINMVFRGTSNGMFVLEVKGRDLHDKDVFATVMFVATPAVATKAA